LADAATDPQLRDSYLVVAARLRFSRSTADRRGAAVMRAAWRAGAVALLRWCLGEYSPARHDPVPGDAQ